MRSQYIRLLLVLLISLSACAPVPTATPTPIPIDSSTPVPAAEPSETAKPTDVPPTDTSTPVPPSIKISYPPDNGELLCDNPATEAFCLFHVEGTISGISSFSEYRLYVFVYPVNPAGAGWYLQKPPAAVESTGNWGQSPAYLGNTTYPATNGDTLKIRVALVKADATFEGTTLEELLKSDDPIVLPDVTFIDGIVLISDIVDLTVNRPTS